LRTRISIHTGPVIITDVGRADRKERLALGGTPNIAARLQHVAPEDGIAVSDTTYQQAQGDFHFRPLGSHLFKGLSEEMEVYQPIKTMT
ncbi:MAG: adenylate/guanylate cyclase domain-containing protein, partial [Saprospiraceae bacterium]|nr:adenylate/guanylate cyclase domain-containing protein [Saprospiraceae bacterium]